MNDDEFYDEVAKEMQENRLVPGVWARAFAEADGDENRAKASYIKRRVAQLTESAQRAVMPTGGDEKAVSWEIVNERWVRNAYANGAVTMSDKETGLMWLFNANPCGKKKWADAVAYCNNLTYAGYSDWQLPDKLKLEEQFKQKSCFADMQSDYYWSGVSLAKKSDYAWTVHMGRGDAEDNYKAGKACVWPVRDGQSKI